MRTEFTLSAKGKALPNRVRWRKSVVLLAREIIKKGFTKILAKRAIIFRDF